ncbi:Fe3+-citrate ABC transporter substrate-binding protein [Aliivibrio sp. S3MY1]|uniref:Fe3+-citrate ABC transporter substrate-binding protein n=1 Tax=Aliivibrio wodanis TaxID=80852 RepID=A0A5Q4ZYF6_9GAMM|nr:MULTISPECIES: Fe3+-citrate ABC transporter substrate-binding protein [Aliivibrio]MDD9197182.1 Fe3+-citrate ABC transporter substrate-binding protein [Aliivibrio sp. S3MY1]VVV06893.1 hypothetical protein AW0309160_04387 [Aliivibrio wodanis]
MSKKSNLKTNTGHRFISKSERNTAFKIHIHTPDDKLLEKSVGYKYLGEEKALKKAIKRRNQLGREMWKKHWTRILNDETLITRLPHTLEPKIINKPSPTMADPDKKTPYYMARWTEYVDGEKKIKSVIRAITDGCKLQAYTETKRALLDAHAGEIEILKFMGRINFIDLK